MKNESKGIIIAAVIAGTVLVIGFVGILWAVDQVPVTYGVYQGGNHAILVNGTSVTFHWAFKCNYTIGERMALISTDNGTLQAGLECLAD